MYDHYIALDWAERNMAVAKMTKKSDEIKSMDVPANLGHLKDYLKSLKGKKILTFEETTTSQWLYMELRGLVDDVLVCDPYRNKLLSEGAKTDRIDAKKLVQLLRAQMLKRVFHSGDELVNLRKLISHYDDLIQRGVRLKNQRSALLRGQGLSKKEVCVSGRWEGFILDKVDEAIGEYEADREAYRKEFLRASKHFKVIKDLESVPGIGLVGAVKVAAIVVSVDRFESTNHYLSYCGLVRLEKISGGNSYGYRVPRHRRDLKAVFKTAAMSCITHEGDFKNYYEDLMSRKRYPEYRARHALARKIAIAAKGVMASRLKFKPDKMGVLREIRS